MIDDDVDDVLIVKSTNIYFASAHHLLVKSAYSQEKSGGVQIRVNTTCRNYGGVRTPRTPMDRRHWTEYYYTVTNVSAKRRVFLRLMAGICEIDEGDEKPCPKLRRCFPIRWFYLSCTSILLFVLCCSRSAPRFPSLPISLSSHRSQSQGVL